MFGNVHINTGSNYRSVESRDVIGAIRSSQDITAHVEATINISREQFNSAMNLIKEKGIPVSDSEHGRGE